MRRGVTLIELLFVMMIIGILVAMSLPVLAGAAARAKSSRTQAIIAKLDQLIGDKWEAYKTRAVPLRVPPGTNPDVAARVRLNALRELMRCELPDRKADVQDNPVVLAASPSLHKNYRRRAASTWTPKHEGAECLYLIIAATRDGDDAALSWFAPSEIGDVDGDGMNEILDGFGQPVEFLRWAPGYSEHPGADGKFGVANQDDDGDNKTDHPKEFAFAGSDDDPGNSPVTPQTRDYERAPDYFDPLKIDSRWRDSDLSFAPYALKPLIFSPGPDKAYSIHSGAVSYSTTSPPNDPYVGWDGSSQLIGVRIGPEAADNITNHWQP